MCEDFGNATKMAQAVFAGQEYERGDPFELWRPGAISQLQH